MILKNGYTDLFTYNPGEYVQVYADVKQSYHNCRICIQDISGNVVDYVAITRMEPQTLKSASCKGFQYELSFKYQIPADLKSGIYTFDRVIAFLVKGDGSAPIRVLYPHNTQCAYNTMGGASLYYTIRDPETKTPVVYGLHTKQNYFKALKSVVVSRHRPDIPAVQQYSKGFLKWFCKEECASYISDQDMDDYANLYGAKLLILIGHNEYWTLEARHTFDKFVENGGNVLILSGNLMWWRVKYQDHLIWSAKGEKYYDQLPQKFRDTSYFHNLGYPQFGSTGADFRFGGFGTISVSSKGQAWDTYKIIKPDSPLFKEIDVDSFLMPSKEHDGFKCINNDEKDTEPVLDLSEYHAAGFSEAEILAWGMAYRLDQKWKTGIIRTKRRESGAEIIHVCCMNWCTERNFTPLVQRITQNAIDYLLPPSDQVSGNS